MGMITAVTHLAGKKAFQPQRINNFEVLVDFTGIWDLLKARLNLISENHDAYNTWTASAPQAVLNYSAIGFEPPQFKMGELEVKKGNTTVYYADAPTFDSIPFKINDFIGAAGKSIFEAWRDLCFDKSNGGIPTSDHYKVPMTVNEYSPDGVLVNAWDLEGCWVTGISEDAWDAENTGKKTVTATIRYDWAEPRHITAPVKAE